MLPWFDKNIKKPIDLFSHPVWFIIKDKKTSCRCVDFTTHVPDPNCKYCFGLGNKIHLVQVNASNQHASASLRGLGLAAFEKNIGNTYYTHNPTDIAVGDIVFDHNCLDIVSDVYYERSNGSDIVYWRIETVPVKNNASILREHILNAIKKAGFELG